MKLHASRMKSYLENTPEIQPPVAAPILGTLPKWLLGQSVLAFGPGHFHFRQESFNHFMDGLQQMVKLTFLSPTEAEVESKFMETKAFRKAMQANKPASLEFGTYPSDWKKLSFFAKLRPLAPRDMTDNPCGGCLWKLPGSDEVLCVSESAWIHQINTETLQITKSIPTIKFNLSVINPFLGMHPDDGKYGYLVANNVTSPPLTYHLCRFDRRAIGADNEKLNIKSICTIPSRWLSASSLVRCFGVTENYLVFVEQPTVGNLIKMAGTHMKQYSILDMLEWRSEEDNKFYVVDKKSGEIIIGQKFSVISSCPFQACFFINSFEDNNNVIVDIVTSNGINLLKAMSLDFLEMGEKEGVDPPPSLIHRYTIPLHLKEFRSLKNLEEHELCENTEVRKNSVVLEPSYPLGESKGLEVGQINPNFCGQRYKYFYCTTFLASMNNSSNWGGLSKVNLDDGTVLERHPPPGFIFCNPTFIPSPESSDEDDGILIIFSVAKNFNTHPISYLHVFLAKTMEECSKVEIPRKIPFCHDTVTV